MADRTRGSERFGWGPSPLASREEQRAYQASILMPEIAAGRASVADLPEAYGGRPTGQSRRAIRMQQAWDAQQARDLQQQQAMQQMEMEQRRFGLQAMGEQRLQREQDLRLKEFEMAEDRNGRIQSEASAIVDSIRGARLPDGTVLNPIRPEDENALERLENLARFNFGMKDETAQKMWNTLYNDALEYRQNALTAQTRDLEKEAQAKVGLAKDLGAYGMSIADFTEDGKINFVKANEAIGRAYAAGQEVKTEAAETKEEKKNISDKITSAEKELLKIKARVAAAQKRVEARPTVRDFKTELDAATIEQGIFEDEINRLNRLRGGEMEAGEPQAAEQPQKELSQQDQVALNWANANPDDPRAKRIKDKLGVQ